MLQWYHIKLPNISILRALTCVCKGLFLSFYMLKSCIRHLSYCFYIAVTRICVIISRVDGALKPWSAIHLGVGNSKQKPGFACSSYVKSASADGAEEIIPMIQRPKWRCSSMLWSMESMTRHTRSHGHPLLVIYCILHICVCCECVLLINSKHIYANPSKALWRWASGEAAGEETLEAVVADLHTGGLVLYVAFLTSEAVWGIRQPN